jgi:hypothetical protein
MVRFKSRPLYLWERNSVPTEQEARCRSGLLGEVKNLLLLVISATGAKAPVALKPLGLLYTLFSISFHCRRQMSPRPTRRERSEQREVER